MTSFTVPGGGDSNNNNNNINNNTNRNQTAGTAGSGGSFPHVPLLSATHSSSSNLNNTRNSNNNNNAFDDDAHDDDDALLHFIQFSDIVTPVLHHHNNYQYHGDQQTTSKKAHRNNANHNEDGQQQQQQQPRGVAHFVRATACRFEVTDAFARGFSRLFVLMSATMIKASTEFNQELLNAACNAQHTLDTYDCMSDYIRKAKACFDFRYVHFLPRAIETIDSYLNRIQELGALQGGPSKGRLDDVRSLLNAAPKPNNSIIVLSATNSQQQKQQFADENYQEGENDNYDNNDHNYYYGEHVGFNNNNNSNSMRFLPGDEFLIGQELEKASEALRERVEAQVAEKKEREEREKMQQWEEEQEQARLQRQSGGQQQQEESQLKEVNLIKLSGTSMIDDDDIDNEDDEGNVKHDKEDDEEERNFNASVSRRHEILDDATSVQEMKMTQSNVAQPDDQSPSNARDDAANLLLSPTSATSLTSPQCYNDPFRPQNLDVILQWCLKRGGRGNLLEFEKVLSLYGGDEAENIKDTFVNTCAFGAIDKRNNTNNNNIGSGASRRRNSFVSSTIMSMNPAIESLFLSLQEAFGENLYFGSFASSYPNHDEGSVTITVGHHHPSSSSSASGNNMNNNSSRTASGPSVSTMTFTNRLQQPSVAALFNASDGRRDDFLVDPCLTDDPSAWPALLWCGTEYLKIQKKQSQMANEQGHNLCIGSTHFFA